MMRRNSLIIIIFLAVVLLVLLIAKSVESEEYRWRLGDWRRLDTITFKVVTLQVTGWRRGEWQNDWLFIKPVLPRMFIQLALMANMNNYELQINGYSDGFDFKVENAPWKHELLGACRALRFKSWLEKVSGRLFSTVPICGLYDVYHKDEIGSFRRVEVRLAATESCSGCIMANPNLCDAYFGQ